MPTSAIDDLIHNILAEVASTIMNTPISPTLVNGVPSRTQTPFIHASSPSPSIELSHASDEQEFATRLISAIRVPVDFTDILVALRNRPQDRQAVISMQRALEMVEWMQTARQELIAAEERTSRARTRVDQVWSLMRSTVSRTAQEIWREHGDEDIGHILGYTNNGRPASTPRSSPEPIPVRPRPPRSHVPTGRSPLSQPSFSHASTSSHRSHPYHNGRMHEQGPRTSRRTCYRCGGDHYVRDCPRRR